MNLIVWILVAMAMVFYSLGEYFSKMYANTLMWKYGLIACMGWTGSALCFLPALQKFNSLSVLGTIWNLGYVMITLFIGICIFRESITTTQIVGLIFGLISIVLLSL